MKVEWYFDYVSPFSYLQWAHQLPRLQQVDIEFKPILLAGLLKHWGQKGPAEIVAKRRFVYRQTVWMAGRLGVPLRMPAAHPFNPLPLLRASIALGSPPGVIDRLFGYVWRDGHTPMEEAPWRRLMGELRVTGEAIREPAVKQQLWDNGQQAIAGGVFGVPTIVANGEVFWGVDSFDFFREYLADPETLTTPEMRSAAELPSGV